MFFLQQAMDMSGDKIAQPLNTAKVYVKVDWPGTQGNPEKWRKALQKALQTWCNSDLFKGIEKCEVSNVFLMEHDTHCAEVQIKPAEGEPFYNSLMCAC